MCRPLVQQHQPTAGTDFVPFEIHVDSAAPETPKFDLA